MKSIHVLSLATLIALLPAGCGQPDAPEPTQAPDARSAASAFELVETLTRKPGDEIVIPYKKYRLANGLTVILHEDRSDPLVHVDVTYHVGSAREQVGKSGFAHLFEHMMFEGSENVDEGQHDKIVLESGGTTPNGTTSSDRTNYFQTVPSNQLERVLWLEADRMGFFLGAVTQEKFEIQRDTVKNERGQRVDNQPYGLLGERVSEALYPEGHPYSWPVIGHMVDLDRVDVNDLKAFFLRWYGPNNATLTIGGDLDEAQTLKWVEKYFGPIPRGPDVASMDKPPVTLDADRRISLEDDVALPLLHMRYPTVHLYHADEAPLDVLMSIMGVGQTSLLYKNMVKNQLAVQASASHGCGELACGFAITAVGNPESGKTLAELEAVARESFEEFEQRGVTEDDLLRAKMAIVSGMIYGLESVSGKVSRLAHYETFAGRAGFVADHVARYENVTAADVMRVYNRYIKGKHAVIMSIVPQGAVAMRAGEDTWQSPGRVLPEYRPVADSELELRNAADDFDRSVMPPAGPTPGITLPAIWRGELGNGVRMLGARNAETPTTTISLRIEAGQIREGTDQLGLAAMTAAMMNESTKSSTNEELSDRLQKLGSTISFGAGNRRATIFVRSLTRNLDATLEIVREKLLDPGFDPGDFARVKAQTLQSIEHNKKEPSITADAVYRLLLLGRDNSIAHLNAGTSATVSDIALDDVRDFHRRYYAPTIADMVVVSDLAEERIKAKLSVLEAWVGVAKEGATREGAAKEGAAREGGARVDAEIPEAMLAPFPEIAGGTLYLVDKADAPQSEIRIGKHALPYDATGEFHRMGIANYMLGGSFNSRINMNLREDKGYTYGARSWFSGQKDYGLFTAVAAVRGDVTAASITEFEQEIRGYAERGITPDELAHTRNAIGQRDALKYETPRQKIGFLANILTYDLDEGFVEEQKRILRTITAEELNAISKRHIRMDDMIIVVVGNKASILADLETLGHAIVELDADGKAVIVSGGE